MADNGISLDGLSVSDLAALQAKIADQIQAKKQESKREVKDKILAILAEYLYSISDIFPSVKGASDNAAAPKRKVKVKYSDGQNNLTGLFFFLLLVVDFLNKGGNLSSIEV